MASTIQREDSHLELFDDEETIEAVVRTQVGPPAWVSAFGLIGQLYLLVNQKNRVVIATNRQVYLFEASVFANKLPIAEISAAPRNSAGSRLSEKKFGRNELHLFGERLWVFEPDNAEADALLRTCDQPLSTAEPEGQQTRRDKVLAANRAVVKKRKLILGGALLTSLIAIAGIFLQSRQPDAFSLAVDASEQYCGGDTGYSAYTSRDSNILVIGPLDRNLVMPGFDRFRPSPGRFDEIVNVDGNLGADVVVCMDESPLTNGLCGSEEEVPSFVGRAFAVSTGAQLSEERRPAVIEECLVLGEPFRNFLCDVAGCPVDRAVN